MKTKWIPTLWLFVLPFLTSAQSSVYDDIQAIKQKYPPKKVDFFQHIAKATHDFSEGEQIRIMTYNRAVMATLREEKIIETHLQLEGKDYELELIPSDILGPDFTVRNAEGDPVIIPIGKHFWGIVNGDPNSLVAMSFFDDEVLGLLSTPDDGQLNLGKVSGMAEGDHVLFRENTLEQANPFVCYTEDAVQGIRNRMEGRAVEKCKNVGVYFEADYDLYRDKQRNRTSVTSYVTGLFNVVALLYEREGINVSISELKIWDSADPYRKSDSRVCLTDFTAAMSNGFNGDIAHLLTTSDNNIGGRAWVDILCNDRNKAAISNIGISYRGLPSYSWSVEVVTHEMGHNLGSPHTHSCSWGPNRNQALDNCADPEGGCARGPIPNGGGTIMSYCHLTSYGINFSNGFGQEPGDLIRLRVSEADCLGGTFVAEATVGSAPSFYLGDSVRLHASPDGPGYDYQWYRNGFIIDQATGSSYVAKTSGQYYCQVSTTCFVATNVVEVEVIDFTPSLWCPKVSGIQDEQKIGFDTIFVDTDDMEVSVDVPSNLHQSVPFDAAASEVALEVCVGNLGSSFIPQLNMHYTGNPNSQIVDQEFLEHKSTLRGYKCFRVDLGDFDPTGEWSFLLMDQNDNNADAPECYVIISLIQKWRSPDLPSDCNAYVCDGQVITLDAGYSGLQYLWSTNETTQTIQVSQFGTYSVTVSSGSLHRSDDIEVLEAPSDYFVDTILCHGESYTLGNNKITESGNYTDSLFAEGGCDSIVHLDLLVKPQNELLMDTFLCYGDTLNGISYNTSFYRSNQYVGSDGCDSFFTIDIQVNPELSLNLSIIDRGCEDKGGRIKAEAGGGSGSGYTYSWPGGATGEIFIGAKTGLITCTVTDDKGCSFVRPISIGNYDSVGVEVVKVDNLCYGDTVGSIGASVFSGKSPFDFEWSTGDTTMMIENLSADVYGLKVTDKNGCTETLNIEIFENDSIVPHEVITPSSSRMDGTIALNPSGGVSPYTYLWSDGPTTKDRKGLAVQKYTVTITDSLGCMQAFEFFVDRDTRVSDLRTVEQFDLYPNPVISEIFLQMELSTVQNVEWVILDLFGHAVFRGKKANVHRITEQIDVRDWPRGVYVVQVILAEGRASEWVVVK